MTFIATFFSHFGATRYERLCRAAGIAARTMPVPRSLSSSCGTCVRCEGSYLTPEGGESDLTDAFTQEGAADTLRGLAYGQAAAIQYTGYAMMLAVRLDPLSVSTLDALRSQILSDMKGEELNDALAAYGAQLDSTLSSSAMSKLPASKIVNSSTN